MLVIKHYYKFELEKEYYCRTEEKASEIVKKIIEKDRELNPDWYDEQLDEYFFKDFEQLCQYFFNERMMEDTFEIENFIFEEDK